MSHIIDADKLLEFVEEGMRHSKLCVGTEPITQNGEYDVVSDIVRRMDLFTYNQLKLVRDYIIENRI
jgi:hypothetical protein